METNAIERVKAQVSAIVNYSGINTIEGLREQRTAIVERYREGIEKMKESGLFKDEEIKEVLKYASALNEQRYSQAYTDVKCTLRNEFVF